MRSKKIKRDKNYVSKAPTDKKVEEIKPKVKLNPTKVEETKLKVKKVEEKVEEKVKEIKPEKTTRSPKSKPRTSPDLLNKHGYNITNKSVDRRNSLGKLVILYGVLC